MVKERVKKLLSLLNENLFDREEAISFSFLSSIAGQSIFMLGPPGVAKSLIARRLKYVFQEGKAFEYLMSRFSTPDEVFGPVSIKQLKDDDKYTRLVDNYLPGASVVFLDEIWKAGPAIQNSLLTVINEKIFRNGEQEIKVKMKALLSASNELPAKGEGLEALWDRFILRLYVGGIRDRASFDKMVTNIEDQYIDNIPKDLKINDEEYSKWNEKIKKVKVHTNILNLIDMIRKTLVIRNEKLEIEDRIIVSDRRWKKILHILRTSAFLNNRNCVELIDCFIIPYCIWNKRDQIDEMKKMVRDFIGNQGYTPEIDPSHIRRELKKLKEEIKKETGFKKEIVKHEPVVYKDRNNKKCYKLVNYPSSLFNTIPSGAYGYSFGRRNIATDWVIYKKDFDSLRNDKMKDVNVYSLIKDPIRGNLLVSNSAGKFQFRLVANCDLMVMNNNTENRLQIEHKSERNVIDTLKPPHKAIKKEWDKLTMELITGCEAINEDIYNFREDKEHDLFTHIFFDKKHGKLILKNLEKLSKEITKLKYEIEQTKHYYDNIKENKKNPISSKARNNNNNKGKTQSIDGVKIKEKEIKIVKELIADSKNGKEAWYTILKIFGSRKGKILRDLANEEFNK